MWTQSFTFESEAWTKEIRKWEDVEAEHELFRPLVGASRTDDVQFIMNLETNWEKCLAF